jgi:hypothetical protein
MRARSGAALVMSLLLGAAGRLPAQGSPPSGVASLFTLDLAGTPLDEFPSAVKALKGVMTVVDKNGQRMLRASSPSEFLITLPQNLPAAFTIILDVIPKGCCAPEDVMLEGTPTMNRGVASVQLTWQPAHIMAVGGGGEMYQSDMPADLAASTPGILTRLVWEFNGTTITLYTNGRRLYTLDKQFARGRVLRVWLGGADEGLNAVYLAGLRIGVGGASPSVIAGGSAPGAESVSSSAASQASSSSSVVVRAPGPQPSLPVPQPSSPLPPTNPAVTSGLAGTSASGAGTTSRVNKFLPPPPRTIGLSGFSGTGVLHQVAPRIIVISGFSAAGGFVPIAPRNLSVSTMTATAPPRTVALTGFAAAGSFPTGGPRSLTLAGWSAVGVFP